MKKAFYIINAILFALLCVGDAFYMTSGELWVKGLASSVFVITGLVNFFYLIKAKNGNFKYALIMVIGLFLGATADVLLGINFIVGAGVFALGHVVYYVAYMFIKKFKLLDLVIATAIAVPAVLFITLASMFDFGQVFMQIVCCVYAIIISLMLGKAISNFIREKNLTNLIIMIGCILFFFSDLMLLLCRFGGLGIATDILCLVSYYPAQFILAFSIFVNANKNKQQK